MGYFKCRVDFTEINQCKPVLLGLSLARNPVKPLLSLYGTEWRERGYGLRGREEGKGKAGGGRERGEEEWGVEGRGE